MRRSAICILSICLLFFLISIDCFAFDWPVDRKDLSSTLGSIGYGTYYQGIKINCKNVEVHPSEEGEIVYYYDSGNPFSELPSGLGSFVVLEHEGDLKTVYGHLEEGSVTGDVGDIDVTTVLGKTGDTGFAYGNILFFAVIDEELGQLINPLLILPPIDDTRNPVIRKTSFKFRDTIIPLEADAVIPAGTGRLTATIYDSSEHVDFFSPMAPYSISVFLNGEKVTNYEFNALEEINGAVVPSGTPPKYYSDYYIDEWMVNLGNIELKPGKSQLEIVVRDLGENETSVLYNLIVVKE